MKPQAAPVEYTEAQVLEMLRQRVRGGQQTRPELAAAAGVSQQFVCDVFNARRPVNAKLAAVVGLQPMKVFRPLRASTAKGNV